MTAFDEEGQISVFAIGMLLVAFAVAGLAVDGGRALIARRSMQSSADAAVVAAAGEIDPALYYRSGGTRIRLQPDRAEAVATRLLGLRGLDVNARLRSDADRVELRLETETPTTFLRLVGIASIPVAVTSRAEPFVQPVPRAR